MSDRPRVFNCTPSNGYCRIEQASSHYALPTRGKVDIIPGLAIDSILDKGFNNLWATALNYAAAGAIDYFLMHHSDVQILTHGWLDVMVSEMKRTGAAVLSVAQAIKDDTGDVSMAVETGSLWEPRRMTLAELANLPETFCSADIGAPLLVNTGLMLVDLSRPEFHHCNDQDELEFLFSTKSRIKRQKDGTLRAQARPEDWEFSRLCHARGLPVFATYKVECKHHGDWGFSNQPPKKKATDNWFDYEDVYKGAVSRIPDGGAFVEVGVWKGKSLAYFLKEAKASGKTIRVVGVDHFQGSPGLADLARWGLTPETLLQEARRNCDASGYPYRLFGKPSVEAAQWFADGSLDFVFIDASHTYEAVVADIRAWLPKVKPGGVLAGHDFDGNTDPDVVQAVHTLLPQAGQAGSAGRCWWYDVPGANGEVDAKAAAAAGG